MHRGLLERGCGSSPVPAELRCTAHGDYTSATHMDSATGQAMRSSREPLLVNDQRAYRNVGAPPLARAAVTTSECRRRSPHEDGVLSASSPAATRRCPSSRRSRTSLPPIVAPHHRPGLHQPGRTLTDRPPGTARCNADAGRPLRARLQCSRLHSTRHSG